jgi:uncharacterized membrane protein YeaQ/YmgE (transglycosylase-associated protein family)
MPALLVAIVVIIALLVVGTAVLGLALKLLWWALIGLFFGAVARLILPGHQQIGLLWTAVGGIAGALLGGVIANAADLGGGLQFLISIVAAVAAVFAIAAWRPAHRV